MDNFQPESSKTSRQGLISLIIVLSVLVIDQIIKILVKTGMSLGESIDVTPWFKILFVENNGMAFGMEIWTVCSTVWYLQKAHHSMRQP